MALMPLTNTEAPHVTRHTLSVLVEDKPGVLARVAALFSRRGFNIESLAVGPTERHDVSRITLRVDCAEHALEQIEKQIHKLVNVLRVVELTPGESVERELALLKVAAPASKRTELMQLADVFGARVADLGPDSIVFELVGSPEEIDSFEELIRPHGLQELGRTGRMGLSRAARSRPRSPKQVLV
jgi:acetolactate synthase-1/3 small subunit